MDAGLQTLFECLLTVQFVVVVAHDLVDIPGWTHGLLVTLINGIFPGFAATFAPFYWNRPKPRFVLNYWVIYCAGTVAFAITMWYVPYIFGGSKKQKRGYAAIYAGTRQVLPARGNNPRPNLLHLYFHALFAINLAFALALRRGKQ